MAQERSGAKGFEMEEALRAYFKHIGYFVVRGVPYRLDDEDITDVDLWLYERPAATSTRRRLMVDVKNRKSPKAAERIIWARGLQSALHLDGAIVATTDQRLATRQLANSLGITLFDGDAITKLAYDEKTIRANTISSSEFDAAIKRIDDGRRTNEWRDEIQSARASLLSGIGPQSANTCLRSQGYFAQHAILAQPGSIHANMATRLTYLTSAFALINFDFLLSSFAFRSASERHAAVIDSIRFGQSETVAAIPTIRNAIALTRRYAENGAAVAKQIEHGFFYQAEMIPAEIIADYLMRVSGICGVFDIARSLEVAASARVLPSFDQLPTEAKTALAVLLDFAGVSREMFADAWPNGFRTLLEEEDVTATETKMRDSDDRDSQTHLHLEDKN